MTLKEIENISFRRSGRGYRAEEVDEFIDRVLEQDKKYLAEIETLRQKNAELMQSVEQIKKESAQESSIAAAYREKEDSIIAALMNAQRQADSVVREANHKAEIIINDATRKSEAIMAQAQAEVEAQQKDLAFMKQEISSFKNRLIEIYREHLILIGALPEEEEEAIEETEEEVFEEASSAEVSSETEETEEPAVAEEIPAVESVAVEEEVVSLESVVEEEPAPVAQKMSARPHLIDTGELDLEKGVTNFRNLEFGDAYESNSGLFKKKK